MSLTLTELISGKITVTGGSADFAIDGALSPRLTQRGISLVNNDGEGVFSFSALDNDPDNGVSSVVELDTTAHPITTAQSLYTAALLVFRRAGGTASTTLIDDSNFDVIEGDNSQEAFDSTDDCLLNSASTGARYGGDLTINGGDASLLDVSACNGQLLDNTDPENPVFSYINYAGATGVTVSDQGAPLTYWYLDSSSVLQQTTTPPTRANMRTRLWLGRTAFSGGVIIAAVPDILPSQQVANQLRDLAEFIGALKNGYDPSAASTDLTIKIAAGETFDFASNAQNNSLDPHVITDAEEDPQTFQMATENGGTGSDITALDVGNYDVSGTITAIGGAPSRSSIFTVYRFPLTGSVRIQYDNQFYTTQSDAEAALAAGLHTVVLPPVYENAVVLGWIVAENQETDLTNAFFRSSNQFGKL